MLSDRVQGLDQIYFEHPTEDPNLETCRSGNLDRLGRLEKAGPGQAHLDRSRDE